MSIIGTLTPTINNGDTEDATVVMALFAFIQAQVNGNACPATAGSIVLKGDGAGGTTGAAPGVDYLKPEPGMVFDYAGGTVPNGYLLCDGSAVSRVTYATLFAKISTIWGAGDGSTTFNLPDLRRRTTIGSGGVAVSGPAATLGAVGGEETHTLTGGEAPGHAHPVVVTDPPHNHVVTNGTHTHPLNGGVAIRVLTPGVGGGANYASAVAASTADLAATDAAASNVSLAASTSGVTATTSSVGGGGAHNNVQPSAVVNKIIKT